MENQSNETTGKRMVAQVEVETFSKQITGANILSVEVGTTGIMGGDTGHGGRTFLRIADEGSTDIFVETENDDAWHTHSVSMSLGGDSELETFVEALEFAVTTLRNNMLPKSKTRKDQQRENFRLYLTDLVNLYKTTGKLKMMSALQSKYKVSAITKEQFFMIGLHKASSMPLVKLDISFCNKVYEYALSKGKIECPEYGRQ